MTLRTVNSQNNRPTASLPRIAKLGRIFCGAVVTVVVLVVLAVILADALAVKSALGDGVCNKAAGARLLFWLLLPLETVVLSRLLLFPFCKDDLREYLASPSPTPTDPNSYIGGRSAARRAAIMAAFAVLSYALSFYMAYLDEKLCVDKRTLPSMVEYFFIFSVYGSRGLSVWLLSHFVFASRAVSKGGDGPTLQDPQTWELETAAVECPIDFRRLLSPRLPMKSPRFARDDACAKPSTAPRWSLRRAPRD